MEFRLKGLYDAAYAGNVQSLNELLRDDKLLLDRVTTSTEVNDNPLHIAAFLGHAGFAREIIQRKPTLARELNGQGMSPLHLAAAQGHLHVAAELIQVDSDLCYVRENKNGYLPVHIAVIKGRHDIIALLIEKCNDSVNELTYMSETIIHLAVKAKHSEIVEFLTTQGITQLMLNSKDGNGNTILHLAFAGRQQKVIKHLLSQVDVDVNSRNSAGFTPLDVLFFTNHEMGDLYLGEMLRAAGGKTSKELRVSETRATNASPIDAHITSGKTLLPTSSNKMTRTRSKTEEISILQNKTEDENYKNIEKNLIVVATLVATITYAAALNPPGGAIQMPFDNSNRNDTKWLNNWKNMDTIYPAGSPVYMWQLRKFFKYDYFALYASVSVILLSLLPGVFSRKVIMRKVLLLVLWFSVYCMVIAFNSALSILLYTHRNSTNFPWVTTFFGIWVNYFYIFLCAMLVGDVVISVIEKPIVIIKEKTRNWRRPSWMNSPRAQKIKRLIKWSKLKKILSSISILVIFGFLGAGIGQILRDMAN